MTKTIIKKKTVREMHKYYCRDYTLEEIGEAFGIAIIGRPWSRQYISKLFKKYGFKTRSRTKRKKIKPNIQPSRTQ